MPIAFLIRHLVLPAQQLEEVELPSHVAPLPADTMAWIALTLGVFLILHLYAKWLVRKKYEQPSSESVPVKPDSFSLQEDLQGLRDSMGFLSKDQLEEALALSMFVRRANGEQWSATDEELLEHASSTSRVALSAILAFTTRILFARCLAAPEEWALVLDQAEAWMKQHAEGGS